MKILPIQQVYRAKFDRQEAIEGLQFDAAGHCVHIGRLSPGCRGCFVADPFRLNIQLGNQCNANCVYCTSEKPGREIGLESIERVKATLLYNFKQCNYVPTAISFAGPGEPLLYEGRIRDFMGFCRDLEQETGKKSWYYLYTNGLLADEEMLLKLKEWGLNEIRFHLGASKFSERVYENLCNAVRHFKATTVETPSWPPHRKYLMEMLPKLEDAGVKHLNITEVEMNRWNFERIRQAIPEGSICQCGELQLYDGGMVYDIMAEVQRRKYSYSVLDCNCFVKGMQRTSGKWVFHEPVKGVFADYGSRGVLLEKVAPLPA